MQAILSSIKLKYEKIFFFFKLIVFKFLNYYFQELVIQI